MKPALRRRNTFGILTSDEEQEKIFADMRLRNMTRTQYIRAAIEAYSGQKIFRESLRPCKKAPQTNGVVE